MVARALLYCSSAAAALAALSLFFFSSPQFPPLTPLATQLLYRLRDILAFLTVTAATAAAIFTTQRNNASGNLRLADPLPSIFSEAEDYLQDLSTPNIGEKEVKYVAEEDHLVVRSRDAESNLGGSVKAQQRKVLHRRASSLNDSVDYEPEPEPVKKIAMEDESRTADSCEKDEIDEEGRHNGFKDLDLAATVSSSSSSSIWQNRRGELLCMSPEEINREADAFIAKFKERMRLQRLDSFQRYRRKA